LLMSSLQVVDKTCHHLDGLSSHHFAKSDAVFRFPTQEKVSLLHDAQKLLFVHLSIAISVRFVNHFLKGSQDLHLHGIGNLDVDKAQGSPVLSALAQQSFCFIEFFKLDVKRAVFIPVLVR